MLFKQLLRALSGDDPSQELRSEFLEMRALAAELVVTASKYYWSPPCPPAERQRVNKQDIKINKAERSIRRQMVGLLAGSTPLDQAHFMVLMSIAKDVERVGDYAKNLIEAGDLTDEPLPDDDNVRQLADIWKITKSMLEEVVPAVENADIALAQELTARGRATITRCDALLARVAESDYSSGIAVKLALGARYYKRICGHLLNVASSVIMPLHKLDYYDEKMLEGAS